MEHRQAEEQEARRKLRMEQEARRKLRMEQEARRKLRMEQEARRKLRMEHRQAEEQARKELLHTLLGQTEEERAAYIDTGLFNAFINAYIAIAAKDGGLTPEEAKKVMQAGRDLLDGLGAFDALKEARRVKEWTY